MNEQCSQTKNKLEELLRTIVYVNRIRSKQEGKNSAVFELIYEWCTGAAVLCRSIGFKLMTLYLPCELSDEHCKGISKPIHDILNKAVEYLGKAENEQPSQVTSYLLANILKMFNFMLEAGNISQNHALQVAVREYVFGILIKSEHVNSLLVHENVSVRTETLQLFKNVFVTRLEYLSNKDSLVEAPKSKKQKKSKRSSDKSGISAKILKTVLNNVCEMAKVDTREEDLLISNLTLIYDICEYDPSVEKCEINDTEDSKNEYLTREYVHRKARSIFTHEKFHIATETSRRILFYKFIQKVLENIIESKENRHINETKSCTGRTLPEPIKNMILKHLMKDRKQGYLEEVVLQIEKKIQDLTVE